jgi:hypothetical protein
VPRPPLVIFNEEVRGPVDGFEHDSQMTLSWCLFLPRDFFDNSFAVRRSLDVRKLLLVTCEMNAHALTDPVRIFALKRQNVSQEGFYAIVHRNPALPLPASPMPYGFRSSSGSLAMFVAIRRASSRVSSLAADGQRADQPGPVN